MGKSSSSLKRKLAKKSPSKGHNKSKSGRRSRKYEPKKILRRADSFSSPDEDYSRNSISRSSSSDDDSYRMRKSRSRTRKYVKGRKKRARKHSCSTESSEESARDRKRKRSKRKDVDSDVKKKKKTYKKKKPRKEASVSSPSSESKSCSTCQSGSESSDSNYEYESRRSRLYRRENAGKQSEGGGIETNRYKSRSSSISCNDSHDLYNGDKCRVEKNSRQLKSVITIPHDLEVDGESPLDEIQNEERGCKRLCSSSGSLLGPIKRESVCPMEIECQKEAKTEIEKGDANADIGSIFVGHTKDDRINCENTIVEDQYVGKKTSEVSAAVASFQSDDLESILREMALENLRKFRQELETNRKASDQKNEMNNVAKQNRVENVEQSKTMPTVGNGVVFGRKSAKETLVEGQTSAPSVSRDNLSSSSNAERTHDGDLVSHKSDPAGHELTDVEDHSSSKQIQDINMPVPRRQASKVGPLLKRDIASQGSKNIFARGDSSNSLVPKLSSSVVSLGHQRQDELSYKDKGVSQEIHSREVSHTKQLENEFGLDGNASSEQTIAQGISNVEKDVDGDSSTLKSSSCRSSSNEVSDGLQFQQKTMQVTRGGEMVQVSYKVYIPKKAPALSRRQLKR